MNMNANLNWRGAFLIFVIYNLIVFATWFFTGADYRTLTTAENISSGIVLPMSLGAVFLIGVLSYSGLWPLVLRERSQSAPKWMMWVLLLIAAGFILFNIFSTQWTAISATHLLCLLAAGVLVGFNEEALTRGILVIGGRGSTTNEVYVWLFSSAFFGMMHLPNTLFGMPLAGGIAQVFFAFMAGTGFYILRRASGTIFVPMVVHGFWDFASFSHGASGALANLAAAPFQFAMYIISFGLAVYLFIKSPSPLKHDVR